jgi:hypothetical protein
VYLHLELSHEATVAGVVEGMRRQWSDAFWTPYVDLERYRWVGDYHVATMDPAHELDGFPLERRARAWKRQYLGMPDREWYPAASPAEVGISFLACVAAGRMPTGERKVYLFYEGDDGPQGSTAAHLNARIRIPGTIPRFESEGDTWRYAKRALVMYVPRDLVAEVPAEVEVWWTTDRKQLVGTVPWFELATAPASLTAPAPASPPPSEG